MSRANSADRLIPSPAQSLSSTTALACTSPRSIREIMARLTPVRAAISSSGSPQRGAPLRDALADQQGQAFVIHDMKYLSHIMNAHQSILDVLG